MNRPSMPSRAAWRQAARWMFTWPPGWGLVEDLQSTAREAIAYAKEAVELGRETNREWSAIAHEMAALIDVQEERIQELEGQKGWGPANEARRQETERLRVRAAELRERGLTFKQIGAEIDRTPKRVSDLLKGR